MVNVTYGAIPSGAPAQVRSRLPATLTAIAMRTVLELQCPHCGRPRGRPLWPTTRIWRRRAELTHLCLCAVLSEQRGRPQRSLFAGVAALSVLVAVGIVALAAQVHWLYSGVRGALCSCATHHRSVLFLCTDTSPWCAFPTILCPCCRRTGTTAR